MDFKVLYKGSVVDCTADPHYIDYHDFDKMFSDVLKVLESDLVYAIEFVTVNGEIEAGSDMYSISKLREGMKKAEGKYAKKHKIEGLYFYSDADKDVIKLPPGITGFKWAIEHLDISKIDTISIAVVWSAFMDHNCSDYIVVNIPEMTVNYQNQDWYTETGDYQRHIEKLSKLLNTDLLDEYWD